MSKQRKDMEKRVKVAGWCSLATLTGNALERLSAAATAALAAPTSAPARAALAAANDAALEVLTVQGERLPMLARPFLFREQPVLLADGKTTELWPLHFFELGFSRSCLRFGNNAMVFGPDGGLSHLECSPMGPEGFAKREELGALYAAGAATAGEPPRRPYFFRDTPERSVEDASVKRLAGWRPGR